MDALTGSASGPAAHERYPVRVEEDAGAARRAAGRMAAAAGVRRGDAELIATELATNILRHAGGDGYLLCQADQGCLELIAADHGPGLRPGSLPGAAVATGPEPLRPPGGTRGLGIGLGTVRRLATRFDYSTGPAGTVVLARLGESRRALPGLAKWAAVDVPRDGTGESGDGWLVTAADGRLAALVVDGLGHGPAAAAASAAAVSALAARPATDPELFVARAHEAMRGTRGGVLGIAVIDPAADELTYAGAGNITGWVLHGGKSHGLLSREGTAGTQVRPPRSHVTRLPWPPGATLILASDGIRTLRDLGAYAGLWGHDPAVAAAVLYRDHERGTDDATVLVVQDVRARRGMTSDLMPEPEITEARRALAQREAELADSRQQATDLAAELEETSRGLIALHAELEGARQAAARLAAIVEWSDDALLSLTPGAVIQTWNSGAARLLGYTAAEITGRPAAGLIPAGLAAEFATLLQRAADGELAVGHETRGLRKDGSVVDVTITCSAIRDPAGAVTGFSVVLHDITARLAAEAELAAARAQREVLAERDRMARDLHDRVIQRISAAGMTLQTAAGLARNPQAAARIQTVIGDLDTAIRELRDTIFTPHPGPRQQAGLRQEIMTVAEQAAAALGFTPAVSFEGPADNIPQEVAVHVLAVCREALSNTARHATASAATVTLSTGTEILLRVSDNGCGLGEPTRAGGLRDMRDRAEALGGTFQATSQPGAGTLLEWRVPLS